MADQIGEVIILGINLILPAMYPMITQPDNCQKTASIKIGGATGGIRLANGVDGVIS